MRTLIGIFTFLTAVVVLPVCQGAEAEDPAPPFEEVYNLVRSNLTGVSEAALNRAAVMGFLDQLEGRAVLSSNETAAAASKPLISRANVFDDAYGYLRVERVEAGLGKELRDKLNRSMLTNQLKGLVLDLRFAGGFDYDAAAAAANEFISVDRPLVKLGDSIKHSTAKTNAINLPVVLLTNEETVGAAEVLAAMFRQAEIGLVIGARTAGKAMLFQDFPLTTGRQLKIAVGTVQFPDGRPIAPDGLQPEIPVSVEREAELTYWEDPYAVITNRLGQTVQSLSGVPSARRLNEADLVRMQREGISHPSDLADTTPFPDEPAAPVVNDPALARALDLLKGLAVVQSRK